MGPNIRRNERDWAGQLISWLKSAIESGETVFQDATNDTGVKVESGRTKFPDVLLFIDKVSGVVFNGWELKFPDTPVDDPIMLGNALEKARRLKAESFVTWNGTEAVIWGIDTNYYSVETLTRIKYYPKERNINSRDDLSIPGRYAANERVLRKRAMDILHDLGQLYRDGLLKPAIDVSGNIISAIRKTNEIIVPQFAEAIRFRCSSDREFRAQFNQWRIYESATLSIMKSSSRHADTVDEYDVLAKFTAYNLIGKILFYLTLVDNLGGMLPPVRISGNGVRDDLNKCFEVAKQIDYQAIFKPYFTDEISYSDITDNALVAMLEILGDFDFRVLPADVIGTIFERLVPKDEKQKFGQYFTSEILADVVAFPVVAGRNSQLMDPTSGTGTFLSSFYKILSYFGNDNHQAKLSQIWGNDVSHFPAILSVINLYKQDVAQIDNFPRVMREDFFNIEPGREVSFPDPHDYQNHTQEKIPLFDGIASNFPFIQQEDIPNDKLTVFFRQKFETAQAAFIEDKKFRINERSDYFTYCVYNSIRFLKPDGMLSAITSNAWLGKEYGIQFKDFLLKNFHIKYVVKSKAEHWFTDSQVSTVFFVLERNNVATRPTRFVTLNFKLKDYFDNDDTTARLKQIEALYAEIDNCDNPINKSWHVDTMFDDLYRKVDGSMSVSVIPKDVLLKSLSEKTNWAQFFVSGKLFESVDRFLIQYQGNVFTIVRGERTGWNRMFVIPRNKRVSTGLPDEYLVPYVKSSKELKTIEFSGKYQNDAFVCNKPIEELDADTTAWILRFKDALNTNGKETISQTCRYHKPYWYSLSLKSANIVTTMNPYKRYFFAYSETPFLADQRLMAMRVLPGHDIGLVAALLNSTMTFLLIEMRGTSRNLGALDLNANYMKHLRILDPSLVSEESKIKILTAFNKIKNRSVGSIIDEIGSPERRAFDLAIFEAYGIDEGLLDEVYSLLKSSVIERDSMKNR